MKKMLGRKIWGGSGKDEQLPDSMCSKLNGKVFLVGIRAQTLPNSKSDVFYAARKTSKFQRLFWQRWVNQRRKQVFTKPGCVWCRDGGVNRGVVGRASFLRPATCPARVLLPWAGKLSRVLLLRWSLCSQETSTRQMVNVRVHGEKWGSRNVLPSAGALDCVDMAVAWAARRNSWTASCLNSLDKVSKH